MQIENQENTDYTKKKKTIYDGINLSERGRDVTVIALSLLLLIFLVIALFTSGK
ncbi:MAG: hypothetical protein IJY23_04415 [Clostridia bacterium]|nr:hypothetical protein [Clostridia bacterium]